MDEARRSDRAFWAGALVLIAGLGAWLAAHMALLQWDIDEGVFAMWGWAVAEGYRPYVDVPVDHPPGLAVGLAAVIRAFGPSLWATRVYCLALGLVGALAVGGLARGMGGRAAGWAAVVLLVLSPHFFWLSRSLNLDLPAMGLAMLGLAVLWGRPARGGAGRALVAGVLLGLGLSIKLNPLLLAGPIGLLLLVQAYRMTGEMGVRATRTLSALLLDAAAVSAGAAAVVASWLLVAPPGAIWHSVLGIPARARAVYPDRTAEYADWLVRENLLGENLGLTALALFGLLWLARRRPADALVMAVWCAVTGLALVTQRPMWPKHHWSLVLWPMALLGGVGLAAIGALARDLAGDWAGRRRPGAGTDARDREAGADPVARDREAGADPVARDREAGADPVARDREAGADPVGPNASATASLVARARLLRLAGGLAVAVWLVALPAQGARLVALANPRQFAAVAYGVEWLARNTPPGATIVSDNGLLPFLSGRRAPPRVAVITSKMVAIGEIQGADLVAAAESSRAAAVMFWNNQLEDFPAFMSYLPTRYVRAERVGDDREIWRRFDDGEVRHRQAATFFEVGHLEGYTFPQAMPRPGAPFPFTLYWRAAGPAKRDYTVFVHLVGPDGRTLAQADGPPATGQWPPTAWVPGQIVIDPRVLDMPGDLPPGPLRLHVGFYDPATGARVGAARPDGSLWADGAVLLDTPVSGGSSAR